MVGRSSIKRSTDLILNEVPSGKDTAVMPLDSNVHRVEVTSTFTPDDQKISEAMKKIELFIGKLRPSNSDSENMREDGMSKWALAQMSESPVLLPDLKFHDLVFGQTLGTGAFSTVRYSRRINKETTRSHWSEYAVKVRI